ncbi:peptide deformylase [Candidatus Kaiserbacteria bacterium]|nr:peptide deformylase [Candidatus Kaiserbacteria bacterium]
MRTILPYQENPALREIASEIPLADIGSPFVRELINDMKYLLAQEKFGVAIAASQVGEAVRLFVVSGKAMDKHDNDDEEDEDDDGDVEEKKKTVKNQKRHTPDQVYINPEMLKMSRGKKLKHEGCLSVKGKWGHVLRTEKATVRAYDEHGVAFTRGASGFLAHVFQHEMDHLDGVLYIDKAKKLYDDKPEE